MNIKLSSIMARRQFILLTIFVCAANIALDRVTKIIASRFLEGQEPVSFFNGLFILVYAENSGAFLSLGSLWHPFVKTAVLLIIPIGICFIALFWLMFKEQKLFRVITGSCIIGGGLSNLADRLINNFNVIDFMNFGIGRLRTGILNVADLSVTFGVIVLLIFEHRKK